MTRRRTTMMTQVSIPTLILLSITFFCAHNVNAQNSFSMHRTYHCRIEGVSTITIVRNHTDGKFYEVNDGRRGRELRRESLGWIGDEIAPSTLSDPLGMDRKLDSLSEADSDFLNPPEVDQYFFVKPCNCKVWLVEDAYCPADFGDCSISSEYFTQKSWVNCYRETVITSYARHVWKYVTVIFTTLTLILCCTRPGHVSIFHLQFNL